MYYLSNIFHFTNLNLWLEATLIEKTEESKYIKFYETALDFEAGMNVCRK